MNSLLPPDRAPLDRKEPGTLTPPKPVSIAELALVFLKLGTTAFGGPAAHIAMMEDEFVRKRQWIEKADFLDCIGMANLIPGPSSTEVAIFIGYATRGWPGLLVAGICFIVPAAFMVAAIAASYVRFGSLPQVSGILYGIKPVVIAIVVQALSSLGRTAIKTKTLALIAVISIALNAIGMAPLLVLAAAGIASVVAFQFERPSIMGLAVIPFSRRIAFLAGTAAAATTIPVSLLRLFLSFLKLGAVVFGSGYVLLAFLRTEFIGHLGWLTERQLIDAVAVGQFTPGPVFTTATFIGYLVAGIPGAIVATLGIFLPGFFLVALSGQVLPKIRRSPLAVAMLDGVIVGSLALVAVVGWELGRAALIDWLTLAIALISAALLLLPRLRVNSAWLICAAALVGWLAHR